MHLSSNPICYQYLSPNYENLGTVGIVRLEHQWALINSLIQMMQLYHTCTWSCSYIYVLYDECIEVLDLSTFNSMSCHYLSTKYSIIVIVDGPIVRLEPQWTSMSIN